MKLPTAMSAVILVQFMCRMATAQAQPLPTPAELQQMFDARQYHTCLQQIARVNRSKADALSAYDPDQLQLLRGECYIQLSDRVHALSAFGAAQASTNSKIALAARANYLVIQNSRGWQYDSETGSIDIVDPQSRRRAMSALFAREQKKAEPAIRAGQNAQTLDPILAVVPKLKDLTALELTATGEDKEIFPAFAAIGTRARDLIGAALGSMNAEITSIERRAGESVAMGVNGGQWWVAAGRRGLDTPDRVSLEQLLANAEQAHNVASQGLVTAKSLKGNVDQWTQLVSAVEGVVAHARNVLDAE